MKRGGLVVRSPELAAHGHKAPGCSCLALGTACAGSGEPVAVVVAVGKLELGRTARVEDSCYLEDRATGEGQVEDVEG